MPPTNARALGGHEDLAPDPDSSEWILYQQPQVAPAADDRATDGRPVSRGSETLLAGMSMVKPVKATAFHVLSNALRWNGGMNAPETPTGAVTTASTSPTAIMRHRAT